MFQGFFRAVPKIKAMEAVGLDTIHTFIDVSVRLHHDMPLNAKMRTNINSRSITKGEAG